MMGKTAISQKRGISGILGPEWGNEQEIESISSLVTEPWWMTDTKRKGSYTNTRLVKMLGTNGSLPFDKSTGFCLAV